MKCEKCGHITVAKLPQLSLEARDKMNEIYELYPRKIGKKLGLERLKRKFLNDKISLMDVERAVIKYRDECLNNKTEKQYIKHFSSFLLAWEDYSDDSAPVQADEGGWFY